VCSSDLVASHRSNKQAVKSFQAAKAGDKSSRARRSRTGTDQPDKSAISWPADFSREDVDPEDRSRTAPWEDLTQLTRTVGVPLEIFKSVLNDWSEKMAQVHEKVLDNAAPQYWTHANWGAELTWYFDDPDEKEKMSEGAVSTIDLHAENIRIDDFPAVFHPRQQAGPDGETSPDPGLRERFEQQINVLREDSPEEIVVERVWVELLQYPEGSDDESTEDADQ
jgi:hypothetical protein